jgi:hypothetical protein
MVDRGGRGVLELNTISIVFNQDFFATREVINKL